MELLHAPRVKPEVGSLRKIKPQAMGTRDATNKSGTKVRHGFKMIRKGQ
jgi:hypothetical protein